jgi:hypothetical protein
VASHFEARRGVVGKTLEVAHSTLCCPERRQPDDPENRGEGIETGTRQSNSLVNQRLADMADPQDQPPPLLVAGVRRLRTPACSFWLLGRNPCRPWPLLAWRSVDDILLVKANAAA